MNDPKLYDADGNEIALPFRWAICSGCDGHGTDRGASVECDGGGFTSEEWAEQDDDFKADYLAGKYDRPCSRCGGLGRVKVADLSKMSRAQRKEYRDQQREEREYQAICAAERRMGA